MKVKYWFLELPSLDFQETHPTNLNHKQSYTTMLLYIFFHLKSVNWYSNGAFHPDRVKLPLDLGWCFLPVSLPLSAVFPFIEFSNMIAYFSPSPLICMYDFFSRSVISTMCQRAFVPVSTQVWLTGHFILNGSDFCVNTRAKCVIYKCGFREKCQCSRLFLCV